MGAYMKTGKPKEIGAPNTELTLLLLGEGRGFSMIFASKKREKGGGVGVTKGLPQADVKKKAGTKKTNRLTGWRDSTCAFGVSACLQIGRDSGNEPIHAEWGP